jgi:hypothetical protein
MTLSVPLRRQHAAQVEQPLLQGKTSADSHGDPKRSSRAILDPLGKRRRRKVAIYDGVERRVDQHADARSASSAFFC